MVDNEKYLCQHGKLHPLTSIKGKFISETIYRYFEGIIQQDSHRYITWKENEGLKNHKSTNYEIEYDLFCCQDCTKWLCLYIKKKMYILEKFFQL